MTKSLDDFGVLPEATSRIMRIPAALLCYWMGAMEMSAGAESD